MLSSKTFCIVTSMNTWLLLRWMYSTYIWVKSSLGVQILFTWNFVRWRRETSIILARQVGAIECIEDDQVRIVNNLYSIQVSWYS